jgi:hypothetical protein
MDKNKLPVRRTQVPLSSINFAGLHDTACVGFRGITSCNIQHFTALSRLITELLGTN